MSECPPRNTNTRGALESIKAERKREAEEINKILKMDVTSGALRSRRTGGVGLEGANSTTQSEDPNSNNLTDTPPDAPKQVYKPIMAGLTPLGNGNTSKSFIVNPQLKTYVADTNRAIGAESSRPVVPRTFFFSGETGSANPDNMDEILNGTIDKYLYVQSEFVSAARSRAEFKNNRIAVSEGIYEPGDFESVDAGTLKQQLMIGRAIGYVVKTMENGTHSKELTFLLASYFASLPWYEKIIMHYDTTSGSGEGGDGGFRAFVVLPLLDDNYQGSYARKLETQYNGKLMSENLMLF